MVEKDKRGQGEVPPIYWTDIFRDKRGQGLNLNFNEDSLEKVKGIISLNKRLYYKEM
ncbi:MAG: Unknown protein [uncultured Campylobacterales bacterium]|uniref:Uncharacterized protein n=1 Tax=uncultured Campylobacterales bacterium TaxID=352960 RepID=A0A6S6SNL5_9BACT|nr:MAG: Unknown protein [uncultured Campylobacterales bacterium]